jgi:hypothetical protein
MSEDINEVNLNLFRILGQEVSFGSLMLYHQGKIHVV